MTISTNGAKHAAPQEHPVAPSQSGSSPTEILANTMLQVLAAQRNAANDQIVLKEVELVQARSRIVALQARVDELERLSASDQ